MERVLECVGPGGDGVRGCQGLQLAVLLANGDTGEVDTRDRVDSARCDPGEGLLARDRLVERCGDLRHYGCEVKLLRAHMAPQRKADIARPTSVFGACLDLRAVRLQQICWPAVNRWIVCSARHEGEAVTDDAQSLRVAPLHRA